MGTRTRVFTAGLGMLLLGTATLTACSTSSESVSSTDEEATDMDLSAAWLDGGAAVALVTQGSSSCLPSLGDVAVVDGTLQVEFNASPAEETCTKDLGPQVTLVSLPAGIDPQKDLPIHVTSTTQTGEVDLPGAGELVASDPADFTPSAGWTGHPGEFVVLSWGSSSYTPEVESTEFTAPGEVTVTYASMPIGQPYVKDLVPHVNLVHLDEVAADGVTTAVLAGGSFDEVRVPIIGTPVVLPPDVARLIDQGILPADFPRNAVSVRMNVDGDAIGVTWNGDRLTEGCMAGDAEVNAPVAMLMLQDVGIENVERCGDFWQADQADGSHILWNLPD